MYILINGSPPFSGQTKEETNHASLNKIPVFDAPAWKKVSREAREFCEKCLEKQIQDRPTIQELLYHAWIEKIVTNRTVATGDIDLEVS